MNIDGEVGSNQFETLNLEETSILIPTANESAAREKIIEGQVVTTDHVWVKK